MEWQGRTEIHEIAARLVATVGAFSCGLTSETIRRFAETA
jgi:hypothetical protein